MNDKCIYCKKQNNFNKEHAFPRSLLDDRLIGTEHEWIIDKHLCTKCNGNLSKIDVTLTKGSPIALIWNRIQNELGNITQTPHMSIYQKRTAGINPVRLAFPNPHCDNRIVLHEILTDSRGTDAPSHSTEVLTPQLILTRRSIEQTAEQVNADNLASFESTSSIGDLITEYDGDKEIYCIFGNTYIFPPETSNYFFRKVDEFESRFMSGSPRNQYDLRVIYPKDSKRDDHVDIFFNSLKGGVKEILEVDASSSPMTFEDIPMLLICDKNALLNILRAIAKIAFHCFLFHYREEFDGHESIFDDIKQFIYEGGHNRFVAEWPNSETEHLVSFSNKHQHSICFFRDGDDIGCQVELFTGLLSKPFSFGINLAGNPMDSNPKPHHWACIPFYMNPKSQIKRRIHLPDNFGKIITPHWDTSGFGAL